MSNTILIKRSSTPNAVPAANSISQGELAINLVDGNLFYKNSTDQVTVIASNKFVTVSGNVDGGNIVTSGQVSATGNITGNFFLGNGALLTGIDAASIQNGNSNVRVVSSGGNVAIGIGGTANVAVFTTTGLVVTGNVDGGNINGNGSGLSSITGGNVTGQVGNALVAGTVYTAAQPNITSVGTLTSVSVTGNVDVGNINGNGSGLSSITGGNVTGQVGNALVAGTVYTAAQPNITSVGTLSSLSVTGNVNAGNVNATLGAFTTVAGTLSTAAQPNITSVGTLTSVSVTGNVDAGSVNGNGSGLSAITGSNVTGQVGNALVAGTVYTAAQPNITSVGTLSSLSVTGTVTSGNIATAGTVSAGGNITGNYVIGNGSQLTDVTATNVGTLTTLSVTGNVNAGNVNTALVSATGNVVGANLVTTGTVYGADALFTGNLTVDGNVTYINITDLNVQDPIIGLGRGPNNTPLTTNDGKDRGTEMWYYAGSEKAAFVGYQNLSGKLIAASNVTLTGEVVTVNEYGTLVIGTLEGAAISVTGNISAGNVSAATGAFTTVTGNANATSLTSGTVPSARLSGSYTIDISGAATTAGTVTTAAQPNITSVGTLTSLSVSGTVTGGNLDTSGTASAGGNVTGANLITGGLITATGNITGGNVTTAGKANIATLEVTTLANIKATTAASSNITGALIVAGGVGVAGNIYAGDIYSTGNLVLTVESTVDGGTY